MQAYAVARAHNCRRRDVTLFKRVCAIAFCASTSCRLMFSYWKAVRLAASNILTSAPQVLDTTAPRYDGSAAVRQPALMLTAALTSGMSPGRIQPTADESGVAVV